MRILPFKGHRFPQAIILTAVRWYCRYGLSYRDVRDLLAERGISVDASTIYRWVQKFGPEIAKRSFKHRSWRGLNWHLDETYVRVGGKWRYLWRAIDQFGRLIDFRLTARRDANAARAFLRQTFDAARLYQPVTITTDKAWNYKKIIAEENAGRDPVDQIRHIDRKHLNNRIESDHAALKKVREGIARSVFCTVKGQEIVILITVIKKQNKIPSRKMATAQKRMKEIQQ